MGPSCKRRFLSRRQSRSTPHTVPQTIADVVSGKADAGVVYFSAAVADKDKLEILRFPAFPLSSSFRIFGFPRNGVGVMTNCQIHLYQRYALQIAIAPVLGFNPY